VERREVAVVEGLQRTALWPSRKSRWIFENFFSLLLTSDSNVVFWPIAIAELSLSSLPLSSPSSARLDTGAAGAAGAARATRFKIDVNCNSCCRACACCCSAQVTRVTLIAQKAF
jgi:hypothetical protein